MKKQNILERMIKKVLKEEQFNEIAYTYPSDMPYSEYVVLWQKYKNYILSDPITKINPPNKKRWDEIEKSFKKTPLKIIYNKIY